MLWGGERERERERERETERETERDREKHLLGATPTCPDRESNLKPRYVP